MKHLRPTSRAAVAACAVAAVCATAPSTAAAAVNGSSTLSLSTKSGAGKALRSAGVRIQVVKPATVRGSTLTLPTSGVTLGASPVVRHSGALRFVKGKRKVTFTSLRTSLGTAPAITGTVGGKRVTLFSLKGGTVPHLDATTGSVTTSGTTVSLTAPAAKRIKTSLKLRRLAAGAFGRATVKGTDTLAAAPRTPAPAPAPTSPAATTPPAATPPAPRVPDPPAPTTPALGQTTWVSAGTTGGSHRSFIDYILNPTWTNPAMCGGVQPPLHSEVTPSGGMVGAPAPADPKYDFLVDQTRATATSLEHRGRIRYVMTCHGIDQWVENLTFVDLDKPVGRVIADGSHGVRNDPAAPDVPYTDEHLLNLDLAGATVTTRADGAKVFTNVQATLAESGREELSEIYSAGDPWGVFSFTLPKP